jgi:glutaminase
MVHRRETRIRRVEATRRPLKRKAEAACSLPVLEDLEQLHREIAPVTDGEVATYIPELAKADPNWFGICLATTNGAVYEVGDTRQPFTIQSISKPFVYGLALEDNGRAEVLAKVGVEPTGDAFNSISLDPGTGRPRNPMINAGAIASAGLIAGKNQHSKLKRILEMFALYAGRELGVDETVYRSESETGHRNRAISHMLRNFNILTGDPIPVVELYFQQCSIAVTCRDLGIMAATLANRGVNPVTGKQAIRGEYVESVLSVMGSCGMYDYAGEWIFKVGMPSKSGVAGGVIAVLPGQLGIGVFSPPLDSRGNSVRGIQVCQELSRRLDLHLFNLPGVGRSTIRLKFTGSEFNSNRVRTPEEDRVLLRSGSRIAAYQLQGDLAFVTADTVVRDVIGSCESADFLILDFKRVLSLSESACRLFYQLLSRISSLGKSMIVTHIDHLPLLSRYMKIKLGDRYAKLFHVFQDNDLALEWCEDRLLETTVPAVRSARGATSTQYELLEKLTPAEISIMAALFERRRYQEGDVIINVGEESREMFFLSRGRVSVLVAHPSGARKRLATFSANMVFGEMAMIDRAPRSAIIVADSKVECDILSLEDFDELGRSYPDIKIKLLDSLSLGLCRKLRKANREISVFD